MTTVTAPATTTATVTPDTHTLLAGLIAAGPLWATVSLAQAVTRAGVDLTRHPLSQLSTGELGWLQIANFVLAGLLTSPARPGCVACSPGGPAAGGRPASSACTASAGSRPACSSSTRATASRSGRSRRRRSAGTPPSTWPPGRSRSSP
ncbi:hypothetical protein JOF56_009710 [Kibdelosporangium banguiense]|uniref:Uncharacterized protein n=1 Tax=Kibdelosporangium banguiense TaxID=1365924 RepID=A0ABS4TY45_9PSEU|nr:hypothetical protein [Kibdelosporangium banguiense]